MGLAAFTPGTARTALRAASVSTKSPVRLDTVKWAVAEKRLAWISSWKPFITASVITMAKTPRAVPARAKATITFTKAPLRRVFR
ncbi:MAG: hypothetical protein BWY56_02440 [Acidobacteria bacterium ADurb.Bin340]|nr:MAG: hypothetical protein BWY56_02440 [Acidobacteria bacterium ADurb.Bin340]